MNSPLKAIATALPPAVLALIAGFALGTATTASATSNTIPCPTSDTHWKVRIGGTPYAIKQVPSWTEAQFRVKLGHGHFFRGGYEYVGNDRCVSCDYVHRTFSVCDPIRPLEGPEFAE